MNEIPIRYRDYFRDLRVTVPGSSYRGGTANFKLHWECRRCGQVIQRNAAGAQSHLAKHVRAATRERPARPEQEKSR